MRKIIISTLFLCASIAQVYAQKVPSFKNGMIVSAHPAASQVGIDILKKGGNAADAAVAVELALAVVYPNAGNIGGGGFIIYRSSDSTVDALDYRETAPLTARENMYWSGDGQVIQDLSLKGALAAGVPGTVDGMVKLHEKYGSLPWADLVAPAIELAKNGFEITKQQAAEFNKEQAEFRRLNTQENVFTQDKTWKQADLLIQQDLAQTLMRIAQDKREGFYGGKTAELIVSQMQQGNGAITLEDLKAYQAKWRTPVVGNYKNLKVISMPPPSSGGIALISLLRGVEKYPLDKWGFQSQNSVIAMVEAERRVYADRSKYLGDPDFIDVPVNQLLENQYIDSRMIDIDFTKATKSADINPGTIPGYESEQTTHYCIVDKWGNAISATTTLNGSYGSHVVVANAGFILNNEMDDFSIKPGVPNMYGLVGGKANAIEPGKRMLSSMSPTILEKNNKLYMVVGTPGGSTIITSVFQTILNVVDFKMNMQQAVAAPRFHHQWLPDQIDVEQDAISAKVRLELQEKGYILKPRSNYGRVEGILVNPNGSYQGGADPRGDDTIAGY
ncbi:gamma-glutamyltransferase [Myroides sp. LJL110]